MEHVGSALWSVDSDWPTMEHVGSAFWGCRSDGQTMLVMPFGCEDSNGSTIGQLHNTKYVKGTRTNVVVTKDQTETSMRMHFRIPIGAILVKRFP